MKPKTKYEIRLSELQLSLKPLSEDKKSWALDNAFDKTGSGYFNKRNQAWCHECGHSWKLSDGHLVNVLTNHDCPGCGVSIKLTKNVSKTAKNCAYAAFNEVCGGFQVVRYLHFDKVCQRGSAPTMICLEAMQIWIDGKGNNTAFSLETFMHPQYIDLWMRNSEMQLRSTGSERAYQRHNVVPDVVYPKGKYIPELRRNGFKGNFHGISPVALFTSLLLDSRAETFIKAGQFSLLKFLVSGRNGYFVDTHWRTIKICLRNGYIVKDASMWKDYLEFLVYFKKDLHNSFYVCPADFKKAHNDLMDRKKRIIDKQREIERREREKQTERKALPIDKKEELYQQEKGKFFGLVFSEGSVTVSVLRSIEEFYVEGSELKHCVHSSDYYLKPNSLVFSAQVDGKRIETVEVTLSPLKIQQARGWDNKPTKHHEIIVDLVSKNLNKIAQVYRQAQ